MPMKPPSRAPTNKYTTAILSKRIPMGCSGSLRKDAQGNKPAGALGALAVNFGGCRVAGVVRALAIHQGHRAVLSETHLRFASLCVNRIAQVYMQTSVRQDAMRPDT